MNIKKISNSQNIIKICKKCFTNPLKVQNSCDKYCSDIYKSKCVEALKGKNPYELAIIIDKNTGKCLGEFVGGGASCEISLPAGNSPLVLLHGHPSVNNITLPVSLQDFMLMNGSNIDKIIAYNSKGEQSFLRKMPDFVRLNADEISQLKADYIRYVIGAAPLEEANKIKNLMKYCTENRNAISVKQEIVERINSLQYSSAGIVNNFWRKNSKKLNLEYFSDFTE